MHAVHQESRLGVQCKGTGKSVETLVMGTWIHGMLVLCEGQGSICAVGA